MYLAIETLTISVNTAVGFCCSHSSGCSCDTSHTLAEVCDPFTGMCLCDATRRVAGESCEKCEVKKKVMCSTGGTNQHRS